jgi:hypothetical protein
MSKSVQYLPAESVSFASQVRRGIYKNSNIAKIAGKFGRSFWQNWQIFHAFYPLRFRSITPFIATIEASDMKTASKFCHFYKKERLNFPAASHSPVDSLIQINLMTGKFSA